MIHYRHIKYLRKILKKFVELALPEKSASLSHPAYYVCNVDKDVDLYLRADGQGLGDGSGSIHQYLFKTLVEAHKQANAYYDQHNEWYPWAVAWMKASQAQKAEGAAPVEATIESQVMEF